ncbi:hypothetical protein PYK79_41300 [Streptomyces sp. ID05-04B]|uniref:hypothetical protein n=1 Tax=Streptomyces sp. ID05-04B TaxID=3028661 RepID=UPI0029C5EE04|nr:hypothetical protein [Streptomyces sp. ID05-04B]MDX5568441.1 hypothetical protein [Streptomyces sp. ID05-04B]
MSAAKLVVPSACGWCSIEEREHGRQYADAVGWHAWERPSQGQILARMQARRLARAVAAVGALPMPVGDVLAGRERVELLKRFERALAPFCPDPGAAALAVAGVRDHERDWLLRDGQRVQDQATALLAERRTTNEALSKADVQRQADRDRIAALEKRLHDAALTRVWKNEDGKKFVFVEDIAPALLGLEPKPDGITQRIAPTQALRPEGEHYAAVHHPYRLGHDLPEMGGAL